MGKKKKDEDGVVSTPKNRRVYGGIPQDILDNADILEGVLRVIETQAPYQTNQLMITQEACYTSVHASSVQDRFEWIMLCQGGMFYFQVIVKSSGETHPLLSLPIELFHNFRKDELADCILGLLRVINEVYTERDPKLDPILDEESTQDTTEEVTEDVSTDAPADESADKS